MEDDPKSRLPLEFGNIEGIQNLDTSRMALRWALERIRSLEKINAELLKKADWELKMRLKAEEEFKSQGELEKAHLDEVLRKRQAELEAKFAANLAEWERDYQRLKAETQRQLPIRRAEDLRREEELKALSARLSDRSAALGAREAEFDAFCRRQRAALESDIARLEEAAEEKLQARLKAAEREKREVSTEMSDRLRALEDKHRRELREVTERLAAADERAERKKARADDPEEKGGRIKELEARLARQKDELDDLRDRLSEAVERGRKESQSPTPAKKENIKLRRMEEDIQRALDEHLRKAEQEKASLISELTELRRGLRDAEEPGESRPRPAAQDEPAPPAAERQEPPAAPKKVLAHPPAPAAGPRESAAMKAAFQIYGEAVAALRRTLPAAGTPPAGIPEPLRAVTRALQEATGNAPLLALCSRSTADNYLYAHSANTAILSLHLGKAAGWSQDRLYLLGLSALLHELGMFKLFDIAAQRTPGEDWQAVLEARAHPMDDEGQLDHPRTLAEVIRRQFAESSGGGHALRGTLSDDDIRTASRLIARCDLYEAMCHPRPWRQAMSPHEALKRLIRRNEHEQDRAINRFLVETLSLYPPGSFVRLSSGEIARAVSVHPGVPTRPDVEVIMDGEEARLPSPRPVSLIKDPRVHIVEAVDMEKLHLADREFLDSLKALEYWPD